MSKSDFRHKLNAKWIGFDPDRMKTVHIANGLFLQILGTQYVAENINRIAVPSGKKGPIKQHLTPLLLEEFTGKLLTQDLEIFNKFRQHVREHLGADDAIYDRHVSVGCAYSAVNERLITDDRHNDGWAGNFIGMILSADFGNGPSETIKKIKTALKDDLDPLGMFVYPFLDPHNEGYSFIDTYQDQDPQHFLSLIHELPEMELWREGFDILGRYYPKYLSKQRFARLIVILSSIVLMRYIVTLAQNHNVESNNYLPFFVDTTQKTGGRLRFTSQLSYIRSMAALDELYVGLVKKYILEEEETETDDSQPTVKTIQQACEMVNLEIGEKTSLVFDYPTTDIDELLNSGARQIAKNFINNYKSHFAQDFFRDIGIRSGILMPRGPYPRKHFYLQPDTIEALLLACISPADTPITMGEFVELLWKKYGIIVGGQPIDMRLLSNAAIRDVNQDDLDQNYAAFTQMMVTFGLAQQRSDGLVLVHPIQE